MGTRSHQEDGFRNGDTLLAAASGFRDASPAGINVNAHERVSDALLVSPYTHSPPTTSRPQQSAFAISEQNPGNYPRKPERDNAIDHMFIASGNERQSPTDMSVAMDVAISDGRTGYASNSRQGELSVALFSREKEHPFVMLQRVYRETTLRHRKLIYYVILSAMFVSYCVYFGCAIRHGGTNAMPLIVITSLVAAAILYTWVRNNFGGSLYRGWCAPTGRLIDLHWLTTRWVVYAVILVGLILYLALDVVRTARQLQSLAGMVIFFLVPYFTCKHPNHIKWRPVIWGFAMQFAIGVLVLRWKYGYIAMNFLAEELNKFIFYCVDGSRAVFGRLFFLHPFVTVLVPMVVYLGCVNAILYYYGLIQKLASKIGWLMSITFHTTAIESISIAVNIFLSVLDTVLMLRKYIPHLTVSEFHCFLVGAHSTLAGFAFGIFVLFGVSPQHLLTACVMSAPAAIGISKLNWPETEHSVFQTERDLLLEKGSERNVIDVGVRASWAAGKSVMAIVVQVIAFISIYAFLDATVAWLGAMVGLEVTIAMILGYVFMPFSYLMGIDWEDAESVGQLLGLKITANEFLSYILLGRMRRDGTISPRSAAISTYAMCGFSSFGTLAIFVAVWNTVDASKTPVVARQLPRIMMNANISCFLTACVASLLYSEDIEVEGGSLHPAAQLLFVLIGRLPSVRDIMG